MWVVCSPPPPHPDTTGRNITYINPHTCNQVLPRIAKYRVSTSCADYRYTFLTKMKKCVDIHINAN